MTSTITIMYPVSGGIAVTTPDSTFDWDYYKNTHMPLVAELFGERLMGYTVIVPKNNIDDNDKYHCIATLYFKSIDDYDGKDIFWCRTDIEKFTNSRYEIILGSLF
tara:strand:- start:4982 stop:5299 length:318 start_codon:yes stop_codon:yes gene_type:complete